MRQMKDSGIEWIGEIPEDWEVIQLGRIGNFASSGIDKKINEDEPTVRIVNYVDIYRNKSMIIDNDINFMEVTCSFEKKNRNLLEIGDIIFTPSSETIEEIGVSAVVYEAVENLAFSYHVLRFRPMISLDLSYKKYMCNNHFAYNYFSSNAVGTIRKTLKRQDFKYAPVFLPSIDEQQKIATYLDEKTTHIDNIIEKTKESIEEYKKHIQSLITETVTKGLNPDVKMKDSGIEWMGEIPEHWEVRRLKDFAHISRGTVDKSVKEDEIPAFLVQYTNIYKRREQSIEHADYLPITVTENELNTAKVMRGDILLTASSETADDIGHSTVIMDDFSNHVFGSDILRIRICFNKMDLSFKKYFMENYIYLRKYELLSRGITRFRFSMNDFKTLYYPTPPLYEQKEIGIFLDKRSNEIDRVVKSKEYLLTELETYKKSLIYEVVTGKKEVSWKETSSWNIKKYGLNKTLKHSS